MMTVNLSPDLEKIVDDAILAGRYATRDEVIRDALVRLEQSIPKPKRATVRKRNREVTQSPGTPLTLAEIHQEMLAIGLISRLPDPSLDLGDDDPDDQPVVIEGEPLSETIIRERR